MALTGIEWHFKIPVIYDIMKHGAIERMLIYLIRHGQTTWNVEKRMQGQNDSPLTSVGLDQAKRIGQFLKSRIDRCDVIKIISSPLGRTMRTAEIICSELGYDTSKVVPDNDLREANHGSWEGLTKLEVQQNLPEQLAERTNNKWNYRFPGGESYADLSKRAETWFQNLGVPENTTIVVTHEMMSRTLQGHYLKLNKTDTLHLMHPNNQVFVLENGRIEEYQV